MQETGMIKVYAPYGTDVWAITSLLITKGGYTEYAAHGVWKDGESGTVEERVRVFECIGRIPSEQIALMLKMFLRRNPNEKCALAIVMDGGFFEKYELTREDL